MVGVKVEGAGGGGYASDGGGKWLPKGRKMLRGGQEVTTVRVFAKREVCEREKVSTIMVYYG